MLEFICLFFPTMISLDINDKIKTNKLIKNYCINNLIINLICFVILELLNGFTYKIFDNTVFSLLFSIKYIIAASTTALVIKYIEKRVKFEVKVEE